MRDIAILGGGIVGLAVAYNLSLVNTNLKIKVLEKESNVGDHQSGRNSGVLHCGLYYKPNSLKANLAVDGIKRMTNFCREFDVPHDICGKVVVATNKEESQRLDALHQNGLKNGLKGLKFLDAKELEKREPFVRGEKSLLVPEEGIVDYRGVMRVLKEQAELRGVEFHLNCKVKGISKNDSKIINIETSTKIFQTDYLVNCTGLFTDRIYKKFTGNTPPLKIVPFRGEYLSFKPSFENRVNHLVYPVPDPTFPFLGVHFTRMISGEREVGPNAVLALKREGYSNSEFSFADSIESLTYPGLLRFITKNFGFSMGEFYSSISKEAFMGKARKMMPSLEVNMLERGNSGVRAQAMEKEGRLNMDFSIERYGNQVHVLNAPSPGATSSLAIADYIINNFLDELI